MGCARGSLSAVVCHERSVRHPRADGARPPGAPERARARRGRFALVAPLDVQPRRDRQAVEIHPALHLVPERVRLRQRPLPCSGQGDRGGLGTELGGLRPKPDSPEGRDDGQRRAPLRREEARQRGRDACRGGGHRAARRPIPQRQHQPRRRDHVGCRRHGEVDDGPARLRPGLRRRTALRARAVIQLWRE